MDSVLVAASSFPSTWTCRVTPTRLIERVGFSQTPSMGRCLMCEEDRKITNEHIVPRWANGAIKAVSPLTPEHGDAETAAAAAALGARTWTNRAIDVKVKGLCSSCNSDQEGSTKRLLDPLIRGTNSSLTVDDQVTLACWAYGKALVMELFDPPTAELGQAMRTFRKKRRPPLQSQIWIGRFDPASTWPEMAGTLRLGELHMKRHGHEFEARTAVIVMGNLIFVCCRWLHEGVKRFDLPATLIPTDALATVWPVTTPWLSYPPDKTLSYDHLLAMESSDRPPPSNRSAPWPLLGS
jgi:hypothetical protein